MAFAKKPGPRDEISTTCHICRSHDQSWRHRHFLLYDGDLAQHLRENLPPLADGKPDDGAIAGILSWLHTTRAQFGGHVNERGAPLSALDARQQMQQQYRKVHDVPPGPFGVEPRTPKGRQVALAAFTSLLSQTRTRHGAAWKEMLLGQFPHGIPDEGGWSDFVRFVQAYQESAENPEHEEYTRADLRPLVAEVAG